VGEAALAVIRQHDRIGRTQAGVELGKARRQQFVRRRRLEVDAQQLLLASDDTQLDGGRQRAIAQE